MEKQIEFLVNGVLSGSATRFIENGKVDTTNAGGAFFKAVRFSRNYLRDDEREFILEA